MAKIFENLLGYFKLGDEDEDYEDYIEDYDEKEIARLEKSREIARSERESSDRSRRSLKSQQTSRRGEVQELTQARGERVTKVERTSSNKIVPIRTTPKGLEVCIMKPSSFEESQDICDLLLSGRAVVVNLEGFDPEMAQRIMDFISGAVYAVNGKLHQISKYIFIFSPDMIDISGDYLDLMPEEGFGVPNINKEF